MKTIKENLNRFNYWLDKTLDEIKRARLTYYYWKIKHENN